MKQMKATRRSTLGFGVGALFMLHAMACDLNALIPEEARTLVVPAESEVTVPGQQIIGGNPLLPSEVLPADLGPALSTQLAQSFSTEGIDPAAVASAKLTKMRVIVTEPEENGMQVRDLGFLRSVSFSLGTASIEGREVAFSADGAFDEGPIEYDFERSDVELVDLIKTGEDLEMTGDIEVEGRPNFATTLRFEVEVTVVADLQGALGGS